MFFLKEMDSFFNYEFKPQREVKLEIKILKAGVYKIEGFKDLITRYGNSYILIDDNNNIYWSKPYIKKVIDEILNKCNDFNSYRDFKMFKNCYLEVNIDTDDKVLGIICKPTTNKENEIDKRYDESDLD